MLCGLNFQIGTFDVNFGTGGGAGVDTSDPQKSTIQTPGRDPGRGLRRHDCERRSRQRPGRALAAVQRGYLAEWRDATGQPLDGHFHDIITDGGTGNIWQIVIKAGDMKTGVPAADVTYPLPDQAGAGKGVTISAIISFAKGDYVTLHVSSTAGWPDCANLVIIRIGA